MTDACPSCGAQGLNSVSEHYHREVRLVGADPEALAPFAPPTSRAAIHGFVFGVLAWISLLLPFFVISHFWRACLPTFGLTVIWFFLWRRARRGDALRMAAYESRRFCPACGWNPA